MTTTTCSRQVNIWFKIRPNSIREASRYPLRLDNKQIGGTAHTVASCHRICVAVGSWVRDRYRSSFRTANGCLLRLRAYREKRENGLIQLEVGNDPPKSTRKELPWPDFQQLSSSVCVLDLY